MRKPHKSTARRFPVVLLLALILCVPGSCPRAHGQEPANATTETDRDRGIASYKQGQNAEAIKILRVFVKTHADDADAWYFLGVAYYRDSAFLFVRDALGHAVSLRPDSADANAKLSYALILGGEPEQASAKARHAIELGDQSVEPYYAIAEASFRKGDYPKANEEVDTALKIDPDFAPALITKSLTCYALKQYGEAAASLEKFLTLKPDDLDADAWREQLERLRTLGGQTVGSTGATAVAQLADELPVSAREATVKARILDKPEPTYTDAARRAGVTGTVVIKAVFSSTGEVKNLMVVRSLAYGLTAAAERAARSIRFTPAAKGGRPVSMYIQMEYNFNLY